MYRLDEGMQMLDKACDADNRFLVERVIEGHENENELLEKLLEEYPSVRYPIRDGQPTYGWAKFVMDSYSDILSDQDDIDERMGRFDLAMEILNENHNELSGEDVADIFGVPDEVITCSFSEKYRNGLTECEVYSKAMNAINERLDA